MTATGPESELCSTRGKNVRRHVRTGTSGTGTTARAQRASYTRRKERKLNGMLEQAQATATINRASYGRRRERTLNKTPVQAQAELERQRPAQTASYARRNKVFLNDAEYRKQELLRHNTKYR